MRPDVGGVFEGWDYWSLCLPYKCNWLVDFLTDHCILQVEFGRWKNSLDIHTKVKELDMMFILFVDLLILKYVTYFICCLGHSGKNLQRSSIPWWRLDGRSQSGKSMLFMFALWGLTDNACFIFFISDFHQIWTFVVFWVYWDKLSRFIC